MMKGGRREAAEKSATQLTTSKRKRKKQGSPGLPQGYGDSRDFLNDYNRITSTPLRTG
jgi:hypothetical protein